MIQPSASPGSVLPISVSPSRELAEPGLPADVYSAAPAPLGIYGPRFLPAQGNSDDGVAIDGRTLSSRLTKEPSSVDPHSSWVRPDNAHLLPVHRNGQPWTAQDLSKRGAELVCQGPLGDCYHEAPLASALQVDPRLITSTTQLLGSKKGVDYYGVVFYVPANHKAANNFDRAGDDVTRQSAEGNSVTYTPVWVVVDDLLPTHKDGSPVGGSIEIPTLKQNVLLNAIREKALGELHGSSGYRTITKGGDSDKVMETFSGYPSSKLALERSKDPQKDKQLADEQFATLLAAHQDGKITSLNTLTGDVREVRQNLRSFPAPPVKGYPPDYFDAKKFEFRDGAGDAEKTAGTGQASGADSRLGYGWVGCHEYSILDVTEENGVKMVKLRNPWGDLCPPEFADQGKDGKPLQNGVVNIPWYLARQLCDTAKMGGRPASEHGQDVAITMQPKHGLPKGLEPPS